MWVDYATVSLIPPQLEAPAPGELSAVLCSRREQDEMKRLRYKLNPSKHRSEVTLTGISTSITNFIGSLTSCIMWCSVCNNYILNVVLKYCLYMYIQCIQYAQEY